MKLVDSALVPAYLEPNSQSMQEKAVEVYRARTISQPEQHTNNATAKHKKLQATSAEVVHRKPFTTTNKHKTKKQ